MIIWGLGFEIKGLGSYGDHIGRYGSIDCNIRIL